MQSKPLVVARRAIFGHTQRLPGIERVTLEGEALHLNAQQIQFGEIAFLRAQPLQALQLVERSQVLPGQGQSVTGERARR